MKIKYKCSYCGERTILGLHFCKMRAGFKFIDTHDPDADLRDNYWETTESRVKKPKTALRFVVSSFIALVLIGSIMIPVFGQYAIYSMIIFMVVAISFGIYRLLKIIRYDNSQADFEDLLLLVNGNYETANRLIQAEQNRQIAKTRKECIKLVLNRLRYDMSK